MKFGVREICDVVLKAKANQKVGNKIFYKNEPVIYFDTLKTSSMEGAATTVYAQGGRGNARLVAWEGERTVTFTMEDALISPAGFMILSGAGLIEANSDNKIKVHTNEQIQLNATADKGAVNFIAAANDKGPQITLAKRPYVHNETEDWIYIMKLDDNGEVVSEPYIAVLADTTENSTDTKVEIKKITKGTTGEGRQITDYEAKDLTAQSGDDLKWDLKEGDVILVDYYVEKDSGAYQIDISADKFGGNYYLEASTLFRTTDGHDMPAEFIIPNCKIQSNFTFTMASSGDPSSFTFTMDAFPDYTRFDRTKKVLAAIQIIDDSLTGTDYIRESTAAKRTHKWDEGSNNVTPNT